MTETAIWHLIYGSKVALPNFEINGIRFHRILYYPSVQKNPECIIVPLRRGGDGTIVHKVIFVCVWFVLLVPT